MNFNAIMLRRRFYVRECQIPILIGNSLNLIQARKRVPDVACVGQRLLTLLWKGEDSVGQIALPSEFPVFGVGLPSGLIIRHYRTINPLVERLSKRFSNDRQEREAETQPELETPVETRTIRKPTWAATARPATARTPFSNW